jgi:HK97 family phage prohead protease
MKLSIPISLTAADSERRIISGRIVTWNEEGNTSAGRTMFKAGSIAPKNVKLLLEHDRTRPIGRVIEMTETPQGIDAKFKIANTTAGSDALEEAQTQLRDGFSVGISVDAWDNKDGVLVVSAGKLDEVSLVAEPAIDSARVSDVAASYDEEKKNDEEEEKLENSESTDSGNTEEKGDEVENTVNEQAAPAETVEAASTLNAAASQPKFYTAPRIELTKVKYLENSIRAALGDDDAKLYVKAADDASNNPAMFPTRQLTEVWNPLGTNVRGSIDALSRGTLPDAGLTFEIPKITQLPAVTEEAEGGAVADTNINSEFISVSVKKFSGSQTFSVELLDRSSPVFLNELLATMEQAYSKATTEYASDVLRDNGALNATARANDKDGLLGYVSSAAAAVYAATKGFARNLVVSPDQWANIMGYSDNGRPIYNAVAPMNAGGSVTPTSLVGNVAGLNLYVDAYKTGSGDNSMFVINPDAYTWYESPRATLRANVIATGQVSVLYYGFAALAVKTGAGCNRFNFT